MLIKKECSFFFFILLLLVFFSMSAQEQGEAPFPVTHYTLDNGLHVILSEDYSLPLVSVVVSYNVGSIHEQEGKSGLAYLLENLMFQGSQNVGRMQHINYIQKSGGDLNATTSTDKTTFYQTVPSNQLALVLWLESDRMQSLSIDASRVENAKAELIQEIQNRKISDPYLESSFLLDTLIYHDFAYSHPVIGKEEDLREMSVEDAKSFRRTYYAPNNAVLSISGNINKSNTQRLIQKYFASIPRGNEPPDIALEDPSEIRNITQSVRSSLAPSPAFHIEYILLRGQSSRLHKRLIKKDRTALYLSGGIEKKNDRAVFKIFVIANNEIMKDLSLRSVFSEISKLKSGFIYDKEIEKSKNMFVRDYIKQYTSSLDRAVFLAETLLKRGTLDGFGDELERYLSVTRFEIIHTMNKYFTSNNVIINIEAK
jgi:zinc protease